MSRNAKNLIEFTCDGCAKVVQIDADPKKDESEALPNGWWSLEAWRSDKQYAAIEVCSRDCVPNALGNAVARAVGAGPEVKS
jgi:hypothetical protein